MHNVNMEALSWLSSCGVFVVNFQQQLTDWCDVERFRLSVCRLRPYTIHAARRDDQLLMDSELSASMELGDWLHRCDLDAVHDAQHDDSMYCCDVIVRQPLIYQQACCFLSSAASRAHDYVLGFVCLCVCEYSGLVSKMYQKTNLWTCVELTADTPCIGLLMWKGLTLSPPIPLRLSPYWSKLTHHFFYFWHSGALALRTDQ